MKKRKLTLRRETVRQLTTALASRAYGGIVTIGTNDSDAGSCCPDDCGTTQTNYCGGSYDVSACVGPCDTAYCQSGWTCG